MNNYIQPLVPQVENDTTHRLHSTEPLVPPRVEIYTNRHDPPSVPRRAASTACWNVHESDTTPRLRCTEPLVPHVETYTKAYLMITGGRHDHVYLYVTLVTWSKATRDRLLIKFSFPPIRIRDFSRRYDNIIRPWFGDLAPRRRVTFCLPSFRLYRLTTLCLIISHIGLILI